MKSMSNNYSSESLSVLEGLDPVRTHPGMYTNTQNPNHLAQEAIDNSVDEALAGFASVIKITINKNNSIRIEDNGRGMPVDIHPVYKISGVELILTKLHAGGKFTKGNYQFSGGLHGVGISVVNALSVDMQVEVKRDGKHYKIDFADGKLVTSLREIGTVGKRNTGTIVQFTPDADFFDQAKFDIKALAALLKAKAVLCPSLTIELEDLVNEASYVWHYDNGIAEYFNSKLADAETLPSEAWIGEHSNEEFAAQWALAWHSDNSLVYGESFVNLVPTQYGGTHVLGLKNGISSAIKQFCEIHDLLPRNLKIKPDDILLNCSYLLSVKMTKPQFQGQTKDKLTTKAVTVYLAKVIEDSLLLWLNENMKISCEIVELIIANANKRLKQAKTVVRKKIGTGPALPGKLTDCTNPYDQDSELFLVEGDSAGGSARQARDKEFQAVLPLRGKILNTWEVSSDQVLASQTVHDIAIAVGVDPNSDDLSKCRYGKICILADADSDGNHISTLLCALFFKHFNALVKDNRIYVAMPPLYRLDVGKKIFYAIDDAEKNNLIDSLTVAEQKQVSVQRFKGLGEMNPSQLRETTMAIDTRRLIKLSVDSNENSDKRLDLLLSKKRSEDRKFWLESNGNLAVD
jgi:topoisomerase-4 subunit B